MTTVDTVDTSENNRATLITSPFFSRRLTLALLIAGLASLYIPMLLLFGAQLWWGEDDSHAGILLLCILGGYWVDRRAFDWSAEPGEYALGYTIVAIALVTYTLGQLSGMVQLLGFSLPLLSTGLVLATGGWALLKRWWLLNLLLLFTVPWLGPFTDTLLVPLRLQITSAAVWLLSNFGLPISATGVMVNVGFVQLNVAGACVGIRSMISIIALGLLTLHFCRPRSTALALLFIAALPIIALGANFIRVCSLIAIAAFFGASGTAAMHDIAALGEICLSIGLFILLANLLTTKELS